MDDEDDAGTFMTRISEDGQGSRKNAAEADDYDDVRASVILPNLQIKSPQTRTRQNHMGQSTEDSFLSAAPKSVGSSRNTKVKHFSSQPRHNRAYSNAMANRTSMYKQGTIPTENLKFSQFLDILFSSGMNKLDIRKEIQGYIQVLETNYTDKIRELKVEMDRQKRKFANDKSLKVT